MNLLAGAVIGVLLMGLNSVSKAALVQFEGTTKGEVTHAFMSDTFADNSWITAGDTVFLKYRFEYDLTNARPMYLQWELDVSGTNGFILSHTAHHPTFSYNPETRELINSDWDFGAYLYFPTLKPPTPLSPLYYAGSWYEVFSLSGAIDGNWTFNLMVPNWLEGYDPYIYEMGYYEFSCKTYPIPEPTTSLLLGVALFGIACSRMSLSRRPNCSGKS